MDAKRAKRLLLAMIALFLASLPLFSQSSQGTLRGGVFDQSGGAIPGATVTVIDVARGVTRALTTDSAGEYVATNLTPGTYTVRAEAKGFRAEEHSGVLVEVGQNIRVDLELQPGAQTQTITVTGEVPAVDTTDSTLGGAVSNNEINSLPLNGRNFDRLLQLRPGVVTSVGTGAGQTESTNGRRAGADLLLLEGIPQIDEAQYGSLLSEVFKAGDSSSLIPVDAIQEFSTEQNPKAEYGWKDGSVVNVGIKSGTNSLHGTAYAFGRDASATDAANYFTGTVTPATLEQFGATAGGRIIKDKLFWFVGFEGLRVNVASVTTVTIPSDVSLATAANPAGNTALSMVDACRALGPAKINALSAQLAGLNSTTCVLSPSSSTFENLFPYNPTASNSFAPGSAAGFGSTGPLNNGIMKIDYDPGPHHHLNGMYYVSKSTGIAPGSELLPQWSDLIANDAQVFAGDWTWTPTSTWVNDARLGYGYTYNQSIFGDADINPANPWPSGYGINTGVTNPVYFGMPSISFSSFTGTLGSVGREVRLGPNGEADFKDSVSYLRGKHAFKFGFEYVDAVVDNFQFAQAPGVVKFTTLQNFLQGTTNAGDIFEGNPTLDERWHWYAGFFQDDWRATPRLTLNLGLRYEYYGPIRERNNYLGTFNPNVNPATTPAVQQVGPGEPISSLYNPDYTDFLPRLGVAWDIRGNGKTVVRAGASLMTSSVSLANLATLAPFGANFPTLGINTAGTAVNQHTPNPLSLSASSVTWNQQGPIFPVSNVGPTCTLSVPCATGARDPNFSQPRSAQWNVDIQRAVTNSLAVDVAYVGNHGYSEAYDVDLNSPTLGAGWNTPWTAAQLAAAKLPAGDAGLTSNQICLGQGTTAFAASCPLNSAAEVGPYTSNFPYLNYIVQTTNGNFSNYDALQITANQRVSRGLSFLAGYTYAHALDQNSSVALTLMPTDPNNLRLNYGNSNNDLRHHFTFSPTYALPGMKSPGQMLEGWSVSGILVMQSGLPWFPDDTVTDDFLGTGENKNNFNSTQPGVIQTWNYSGSRSAFTETATSIPCYGVLGGCTAFASAPASIQAACQNAAQAPYAGNAQLQQLALASLANEACYIQNGGVLTPPAYGTIGNANRNLFRGQPYYNVDFAIQKIWHWKERYTAQFRLETFNLFNRADFAAPASTDPSKGSSGGFGYATSTPDSTNAVLGSGGPRHIQFGLKLTY